MKLISCSSCGIILDADKLKFAEDIWDEHDYIDVTKARYNQNTRSYQACVPCPVCKEDVFEE